MNIRAAPGVGSAGPRAADRRICPPIGGRFSAGRWVDRWTVRTALPAEAGTAPHQRRRPPTEVTVSPHRSSSRTGPASRAPSVRIGNSSHIPGVPARRPAGRCYPAASPAEGERWSSPITHNADSNRQSEFGRRELGGCSPLRVGTSGVVLTGCNVRPPVADVSAVIQHGRRSHQSAVAEVFGRATPEPAGINRRAPDICRVGSVTTGRDQQSASVVTGVRRSAPMWSSGPVGHASSLQRRSRSPRSAVADTASIHP